MSGRAPHRPPPPAGARPVQNVRRKGAAPAPAAAPATAAAAPKVRKTSKVIDAVEKAKSTLERIKEDEQREAREARDRREQKVLGKDLDWKLYLRPADTSDLEQCRRMDAYNQGVFEHNNAMLPAINELLSKMGYNKHRCDPPPKYLPIAKQKYEEMLFNPEFRILRAIRYLAEQEPPRFACKDYKLVDGPELADDIAEELERKRLIEESGGEVDITAAAGRGHAHDCTCENKWDGVSERCLGEGTRVRWVRLQGHHFMRPRIGPQSY